jgi:glucose-6-phosphate dehydrogenase assembly protein OpcA
MMATEEVQLINLEKELLRLWDEEQGKKLTRAAFFNLVIYAEKSCGESDCLALIHSVVSKFPCRVFLIVHEKKGNYLKTSLSSHNLSEGIFCEIIKIEVAGSLQERVPYIILPHILPDLPLYLLWTEDPGVENQILPQLEPFAKRVIFDVDTYVDLQKTSQNLLSVMEELALEVGDLHWTAMKGWRKIFSSIFDTPRELEKLVSSKLIKITYHDPDHGKHLRSAAYFQGWMASRLGWRFKNIEKNEGNARLLYGKPSGDVVFLLIPDSRTMEGSQLPLGALLSIEIDSTINKSQYTFKRTEGRQVFYQYNDNNECGLPLALFLSGMSEGQEIIEEIFYPTKSKHFHMMLENLAHIPWGAS